MEKNKKIIKYTPLLFEINLMVKNLHYEITLFSRSSYGTRSFHLYTECMEKYWQSHM